MAEINLSLVVFTLLIGVCTGTFIFYALWQSSGISSKGAGQGLSSRVLLMLLICLGVAMLASATHLGKPFRFINAFSNLNSMITQEGIWSIGLGITLFIAVILAFKGQKIPKMLYLIGGFIACGLLLVSSLVYVKASGFPAWSNGLSIVYYFSSAILLGVAVVFLIGIKQADKKEVKVMAFVALAAVCIQIIVTAAFAFHLYFNVTTVTLPSTIGLDVIRWVIGLLAPVVIAYLVWYDKINSKSAAWTFMTCVLIGEISSRLIFFMQGIHL